ncbi:MAG: hypothetical protein AAGG55_14670 [Pseudomonadota bacterium]
MQLILHIGTEKTGSTAIQERLEGQRGDLADHGLLLPDFLNSSNHRALASVFMRNDLDDDYLRALKLVEPAARARHRDQLFRNLEAHVNRHPDARALVISAEHFHSRLLHQDEVNAFADRIKPLFDDIKIICYLRRQDHMALSFYTQKLRAGFIPPTILPVPNIRRLRPALPLFFDFEALLERWSVAFGDAAIEPAVYARSALIGGDVLHDFFARIQFPLAAEDEDAKANQSLSSAGQMALLAFNRERGGDLPERTAARDERERLSAYLQRHAAGKGVTPSVEEATEFLAAFDDSNRSVARRWFEREELFPADLGSAGECVVAPDHDGAEALLRLFREQDRVRV